MIKLRKLKNKLRRPTNQSARKSLIARDFLRLQQKDNNGLFPYTLLEAGTEMGQFN